MAGTESKAPAAQLVDKASRMTAKKRAALEMLTHIGGDFFEYGTPPYAVSLLAEQMGTDLANLAKTMRGLERMGLVVREVAQATCWNAIARNHMERRCVCYWLAATMEQDKARAQEWIDGAEERSRSAFERMFAPRPAPAIDVSARVLTD